MWCRGLNVNPNSRLVFLVVFTSLIIFISHAESANIVFFFGLSTYSHRIPAWPLAEGLAEKGHNVTFVSPFPAKRSNPKVRDYVPKKLKEWVDGWGDLEDVFVDRKEGKLIRQWLSLTDFGVMMCNVIYDDEEYVKWVKESTVDLVFIDPLVNECAYGMAHYWKAKTVVLATSTAFGWYPESFGLPDESAWIPSIELYYPLEMTLGQRILNAIVPIAWHLQRTWMYFPQLEEITKAKIGITDMAKFEDVERNISLVFLNTHYAEEFARSLPPHVIPIGGIAWTEQKNTLPKDLETFMGSGQSIIYVSFGTYADFTKMDTDVQNAIIGSLKSFPKVKFVWKVSNHSLLQEFPDKNVYICSWMPQQEILAHPNVKAFITHSGLLGIQEAITCGVPLISFPIFAEQDYNAERIHRKEYGIRLEITTVKQGELENAINMVLTDPKYRNNVRRISTLFKDRPQKPLDVALWWTSFVLRHSNEDLAALRPSNLNHSWWKKRNLDAWLIVFAMLITTFSLIIYISSNVLFILYARFYRKNTYVLRHKKKTK